MLMISTDPRYLGIAGDKEREKAYHDFWDMKVKKEREQKRQHRRMTQDRFKEFLQVRFFVVQLLTFLESSESECRYSMENVQRRC